jgi:hypothetical protein
MSSHSRSDPVTDRKASTPNPAARPASAHSITTRRS